MFGKILHILMIILWIFIVRLFIYRNNQRDLNKKRFSIPKPLYFLMFPYLRRKFNVESNFQATVFEVIFFILVCIPNMILCFICIGLLIFNDSLSVRIMHYDAIYVVVSILILYILKDIFDREK